MYQPLADALRPQELSDVCGQQHILGENGLLRRIIESGSVPNLIFYRHGQDNGREPDREENTAEAVQAQRNHGVLCRH